MTHYAYAELPSDARELLTTGLQALKELKRQELQITAQNTVIIQAVTAHRDDMSKWPLPAPWPEGFVVQRADKQFICLDPSKIPRAWTPFLKEAYVWRTRDMAESAARCREDISRCSVWSIEDICSTIGATS